MKYAVIKIGGSILSDLCDTIIEDIHALKKIITHLLLFMVEDHLLKNSSID